MIIVMRPGAKQSSIDAVIKEIKSNGLDVHLSKGKEVTIIGVVGDKTKLASVNLMSSGDVEKIVEVTESYKLANKKFHPEPSIVPVGNTFIGPGYLTVISGPCAIENEEQMMSTAKGVKEAGATILRGGAYKPRTSPYSFQGLGEEGLKLLRAAGDEYDLPIECEVISRESIETAAKYVDMFQIGARNMQNFYLLKEVGKTNIPVFLKRGLSSTIDEWLNAAEYIMSEGNKNVVLCERGIRTFETATRNTLDIAAVPVLKSKTHLPVLVDPSHASGVREYIPALSKSAIAAGADGLMIEVHIDPSKALSDGPQSLNIPQFKELMKELEDYKKITGRK
ncbi:3-deoxy-D-arabinoheptulosonate-7-phosphate synthase [Acetitomaculum ruminis DSM 5522]|uniref:3-deoxy-D-arabinoheptulosonate-7-phosphate synthase n=1 Tax=Acetitomaculum ruminis DSM 5522 TaxID=1120918 RepID=A0A1I0VHG3_9FIRM|nr:3-deoxy-7-phosphoheptulonate synthase [Acetitomaculum ruminis]SFA75752.1 3-deoxy-D-arabinoheptulosonate-7-phosphate synthase [Acetitomaculum ruminis DSM 5522]